MPSTYFPLRWESTGEQWWYASPIDWAAANGHYDLVRELLHLDANLLIKLTSLRRIRRLETVWDDESQFNDAAKCRSQVAQKLLVDCESNRGHNSLIRAGYGGWLLYTAASAGDLGFVKELLVTDPLLVFGEGEYGVTDILYAAARSNNSEVFRLLLDVSVSQSVGGEVGRQPEEVSSVFRWEMMNRAVHAAARGGSVEILRKLLGDCSDVLIYRDGQGSTILHSASGRGQTEVVKDLIASYDIIACTDKQGNTALNIAAYRCYLAVVEVLILASHSITALRNNNGDTFLHMAVAGFRSPGFRRLDRQIELMKQLVCGKLVNLQDVINVRNNDGRTAFHMAIIENIQSEVMELLMTVPSINLNICDANGMTALDLLKQRPRSAVSEILIKRLMSAGGTCNCQDYVARSAFVSHMKVHGIGGSPGTSFRIPDAEIFLYTGIENASGPNLDPATTEYSSFSSELSNLNSPAMCKSLDNRKSSSINNAARKLKILLRWPRKERKADLSKPGDDDSLASYSVSGNLEDSPISLRQRFSKNMSLPNNRRILCVRNSLPSPSTKKKFAARLMHGVIQAVPQLDVQSPLSPFSESSRSPALSIDKQNEIEESPSSSCSFNGEKFPSKRSPFNKKLMNQYFCFGAQGLVVEDSVTCTHPHLSDKHSSS
ncbi:uncharacterized protein LOC127809132 [Diospyros lotus]|uniref:uncharacterized protein LOC127809132 n=1 Tax=Diospyros lotus TaxID=55363 RepID=UPI002258D030|nr:uncharacterized protein LOC127809132 [Diospyros lotus]